MKSSLQAGAGTGASDAAAHEASPTTRSPVSGVDGFEAQRFVGDVKRLVVGRLVLAHAAAKIAKGEDNDDK